VDNHKVIGEDYYKDIKSKLHSRKSDTSTFENVKYGDFKRDDFAGYGIHDQLGFKFDDRLTLDIEEDDITKKYEKLMAERQNSFTLSPEGQVNIDSGSPRGLGIIDEPRNKKKINKDWR